MTTDELTARRQGVSIHKNPDSDNSLHDLISLHVCLSYSAGNLPCNLLIFALSRLHLQTELVHFMHIASRLHVG